jgi:sulfur relay (sulfurtransferase) DsrC/TusE family protein
MIDFELTEDHKALVQTVREFAQKEVAPTSKSGTRSSTLSRGI